jgi:predicted nucleic acid-binding protein
MILVDTSIWIDFFSHRISVYGDTLQNLIEAKRPICITEVVLAEVLQGFYRDRDYDLAKRFLLRIPRYSTTGVETFVHAADIYRTCREKGYTPRGITDCLIAAIAIENGLRLFHKDKHFDRVAEYTDLKTLGVE